MIFSKREEAIRTQIAEKIKELYELKKKKRFIPGQTRILYASAVYDHNEVVNMVNTIFDGWFGVGKQAEKFEKKLSNMLGVNAAILTNSGSSSNLIAVSTLCSSMLRGREQLKHGDEVITSATTFPTTVNPIFQNGLTPVFVDSRKETFNLDPDFLEEALSRRTRAIVIPHIVGIPNEMDAIMEFAVDHDLYLIEDTCDALGSKYDSKHLGTFGTIGTFSFYAAHHLSMGEGGAITSNDDEILQIARSIRDWGRALDIKREPKNLRGDELPEDYDLRYVYVTRGYNLKPTEIQPAKGVVQLDKLGKFVEIRKRNYNMLYKGLQEYGDYFHFAEPPRKGDVSWFAFPLTVSEKAPFRRKDLLEWLNKHCIDTRAMLAGNILRHPAYKGIKCRVAGLLKNSDYILHNSFFMGLHPGLHEKHIQYILDTFRRFIKKTA